MSGRPLRLGRPWPQRSAVSSVSHSLTVRQVLRCGSTSWRSARRPVCVTRRAAIVLGRRLTVSNRHFKPGREALHRLTGVPTTPAGAGVADTLNPANGCQHRRKSPSRPAPILVPPGGTRTSSSAAAQCHLSRRWSAIVDGRTWLPVQGRPGRPGLDLPCSTSVGEAVTCILAARRNIARQRRQSNTNTRPVPAAAAGKRIGPGNLFCHQRGPGPGPVCVALSSRAGVS